MDNNEYVAPDYEVLNSFSIPYLTFKHLVDTLKARYTDTDGYRDPIKFAVLNDLDGLLYREMAAVATEIILKLSLVEDDESEAKDADKPEGDDNE